MTKGDIIEMAREAAARHGHTFKEQPNDAVLEIMAEAYAMGAAAEREACAMTVENYALQYSEPVWALKIVNAIRARSQS